VVYSFERIMELPQAYTISKFYSISEGARQYSSYINGGCPICHEGSNWGRKRRLYYYLSDDFLYCYNCARSWNPYWWVKEATGMSYREIREDMRDYDDGGGFVLQHEKAESAEWVLPELPGECVNLKSQVQLDYYKGNRIVQLARQVCEQRRLFTALNSPKALYVCINDKYHKNRLIIPFYKNNKIESYTSRKLLDSDTKAKYVLKFNSKKPLFGIDNLTDELPYIFIFEGQIDSFFLKNAVAVSGLELTIEQEEELRSYPFHQRIWVMDNLKFENDEVKRKASEKLKNGESLFFYENDFTPFKDLNDYCVEKKLDAIDPALILNNVYSGGKGLLKI
jgi:hypothetical protein